MFRKVFFIVVTMLLCIGCTDGDRMRRDLARLEARNQADSLLTDSVLAQRLADYFAHHGTQAERLEAHYLLARTWADLGQAPRALEAYHTAAEQADTNDVCCDYKTLNRVYSQMAYLFYQQNMPNEMLSALQEMEHVAIMGSDTLSLIAAIEQRYTAYDMLGKHDEAKRSILLAYNKYISHGFTERARNCLPAIIDCLIDEGDYSHARKYMYLYEQGLQIVAGELVCNSIYLYFKGNYYLNTGQPDSAELYFRRELAHSGSLNEMEAAYKGLCNLFQHKNNADSVAKYAYLCYETSDQQFRESCAEELQHMQHLYDYSHSQKMAFFNAQAATRNWYRFVIAVVLCVFLIIFFSLFIMRQRSKKRREIQALRMSYKQEVERLEKARSEYAQLKDQEVADLLNAKKNEIGELTKRILQMESALNMNDTLEKKLTEATAYKRMLFLASHPSLTAEPVDWQQLSEMMDRLIPNFRPTLFSRYHLSAAEYRICMLERLFFPLSAIAVLTGETSQSLSKKRRNLLNNLFQLDGKPALFDKLIRKIH